MTHVWLAGHWRGDDVQWELVGVFDSEAKADAACTAREHFYAPVLLNEIAPEDTTALPDCRYPRIEDSTK